MLNYCGELFDSGTSSKMHSHHAQMNYLWKLQTAWLRRVFCFFPCCVVITNAAPIITSSFRSVDMSNAWYRRLAFTDTSRWVVLLKNDKMEPMWGEKSKHSQTFKICGFNYSQTMFFLILFSIKSITARHQRVKLVSYSETAHEGLKRFAM